MKGYYILLGLLLTGMTSYAQKKAVNATSQQVKVAKTGEVTGFESNLAEGKLNFTKTYKKDNSGNFAPTYTIRNNYSSNNGNPVEVTLNKESFDGYFQKNAPGLMQVWSRLVKYARDKKLSFSDEKTWSELINQYNNSK